MTKIVINTCFGGFGISRKAMELAASIAGEHWGGTDYPDVKDGVTYYPDVHRDDKVLVKVVEELGEAANGYRASLSIVCLQKGTHYRIVNYDGREHIENRDNVQWEVAE